MLLINENTVYLLIHWCILIHSVFSSLQSIEIVIYIESFNDL